MGGEPYYYVVDYDKEPQHALTALRRREFENGRYFPEMSEIDFSQTFETSKDPISRSGQPKHDNIDAARDSAGAAGTRSILDIDHISDEPDDCAAYALDDDELQDFFGTTHPTIADVDDKLDVLLETIERGTACYFTLWRDDIPESFFFAGYSFD